MRISLLVTGLLFLCAFMIVGFVTREPMIPETEILTTSIVIEGLRPLSLAHVRDGTTVLEFLQMVTEEERIVLDVYTNATIERIGSLKSGDDGKFWSYTINAATTSVPSSVYTLKNNDAVVWSFSPLHTENYR